ncbi:MAG: transketolase C-terminal domain-containing protein, partial [Zestosphaera sp.]
EGYSVLVESLIHDERGFYKQDKATYRSLVNRIVNKVLSKIDSIFEVETYYVDDYRYLLVSFGSTARSALAAVRNLRKSGVKAGLLRLKTLWPLKHEILKKYCEEAEKVFVVENNTGKILYDIERVTEDDKVVPLPLLDLEIPEPKDIVDGVRKWL